MTAESWEEWRAFRRLMRVGDRPPAAETVERFAKLNDFPDDAGERKVTRAQVEALRIASGVGSSDLTRTIARVADVLASYLPPDASPGEPPPSLR